MSRRVGLILDPVFEKHETGGGHPESPGRLAALRDVFEARGLVSRCEVLSPVPVERSLLEQVHEPVYLARVEKACATGPTALDPDTVVGRESSEVAALAAGSLVALCRQVAEGNLHTGFAAVRPPGHHAERSRSLGFCLYNSIAMAAEALLGRKDTDRVLVVDWDVHHGNGTQHSFEEDDRVFYFSVHQHPLFPGTGAADETGSGKGKGCTLNRPLPPGSGDGPFLDSLEVDLAQAADRFQPDFVLVSAGFDAHRADPLAGLTVSTAGFAKATEIVRTIAERLCEGRLVSVLEGGYDLQAMPESAAAHLETLLRS
jgi:acetoin utilization deacetylase AcuC-like enzyme